MDKYNNLKEWIAISQVFKVLRYLISRLKNYLKFKVNNYLQNNNYSLIKIIITIQILAIIIIKILIAFIKNILPRILIQEWRK